MQKQGSGHPVTQSILSATLAEKSDQHMNSASVDLKMSDFYLFYSSWAVGKHNQTFMATLVHQANVY